MWKALTKFIGVIANGGYDVSSDARSLSSEMCERLVEPAVRGLDQVYWVPDLFSMFSLGLEVRDEKMQKAIQTDERFNYCIGFTHLNEQNSIHMCVYYVWVNWENKS